MKKKVFIDGSAGTTGLKVVERLESRDDIELILLPDELRKDTTARKEAINAADVAFLCLPDAAAIEAAGLVENDRTVIIDTSTAHRTNPVWTYGFAELAGQREKIKNAKLIANPGCHASGFIALVAPLVQNGVLDADTELSAFSLTGYSGGGKKMIAEYECDSPNPLYEAPRMYGLTQKHKHLPEMTKVCGLTQDPVFCPVVADYYSGMEVIVPIFKNRLKGGIEAVKATFQNYYSDQALIKYVNEPDEAGFMSAAALSGKDTMQVSAMGNEDRILLVSRFDNLGKGASGAAIQNMNIVLGVPETTGLVL